VAGRIESSEASERWRNSAAAVQTAVKEVANLRSAVQETVKAVTEAAPSLGLQFVDLERDVFSIRLARSKTTFGWSLQYSNSLSHSYLFVRELSLRDVFVSGNLLDREWEPDREVHMELSLQDNTLLLWTSMEEPDRSFTTRELADWHVRKLLEQANA
jgi:hypothetical protein